jgi:hypothetical protein
MEKTSFGITEWATTVRGAKAKLQDSSELQSSVIWKCIAVSDDIAALATDLP